MATVYKVEIKMVSAWVSYPPEYIEKMIKKMLDDADETFENVEINAERTA